MMRGLCLNWKVVAGLAGVGLAVYVVAPGIWTAAAPLLILAACPLSMLVMMWAMRGSRDGAAQGSTCPMPAQQPREVPEAREAQPVTQGSEPRLAELKAELEQSRERQEAIARRIADLELAGAPAVREAEAVARAAERREAERT